MVPESELPGFMINYMGNLPFEALSGDVFAVSILLILFYAIVFVINKLTEIIVLFLKKVILLIIVTLAFYRFLQFFVERLVSDGPTSDTLIFGGFGFIVGCVVIIIAFNGAVSSLGKVHPVKKVPKTKDIPDTEEDSKKEVHAAIESSPAEDIKKHIDYKKHADHEGHVDHKKHADHEKHADPKKHADHEGHGDHKKHAVDKKHADEEIVSITALKEDKRLGVIIAYLIVAEFGVISSKTVAAPDITTGIIFFVVFMVAALFFINQSYNDRNRGIRHFILAFLIGGALSIILGYFWGGYSISELLSESYFISDSLVAFVTGIAVSLFMGSKG